MVQKQGDQASIVGGAINFLKELEHHLQFMKGQKKINKQAHENSFITCSCSSPPFTEFFMFPQYSMGAHQNITCYPTNHNQSRAMADIEVTLVDSQANIKIMLKKRQGQVMKMVVGIQNLGFNILHLNVSSVDDNVLVSVSAKVNWFTFCLMLIYVLFTWYITLLFFGITNISLKLIYFKKKKKKTFP